MSGKLSLLVNFIGVDKMSGAIRNIMRLGQQGSRSLGELRGESKKLERELAQVRRQLDGAAGDTSDLVRRQRELEEQLERTNRDIEQQRERLAKIGKGRGIQQLGGQISAVGQSATVGLTLPLLAAGYASTQMASEFNASMSNVATLVDTSTESMSLMGKQVLQLSTRVPVQLDQLPPALYDIRSAGTSASDAMSVLEGSAKLAVAGLSTTQEAADVATSSINAFGLKGAEQQRIYDLLFKTVKYGKTTISGLAQGFGAVAGTIANAGVQIDEYLASVAALTTTGLPAAQAHTQLRAVIAGLTRETEQSRAVFQKLGAKDYKDLIAQSGGLVPALNRIRQELGGSDAEMLKLFGSTEALGAVLGLTGGQAEAFSKALDDMRNGANAIDPAVAKQSATDAAQQIENMNKFRTAAIEAGNAILPVMTQVMTVVADVANSFSQLDPGTQSFIIGALGIVAAVGPVIMLIGGLVSIFGTLTVAAAILGVGVGTLAGLLFGIPIAIAVVAGLIWYFWDDIMAAFKTGWSWVENYLKASKERLINLGKALMDGLLLAINPMALGKKLIEMASNGITAFKNFLGIKSPSRVFMALGQFTTEGLAQGIDRGGKRPVRAMKGLAAGVAAAGAFSLTPAAAAGAGQQAAAAAQPGAGGSGAGMTVTINIQQQPGEDATALAERVRIELERLAGQAARSSYSDG